MPYVFLQIFDSRGRVIESHPILKPHKHHIDAVPVSRQQAGRIQKLLKNLIIGREPDFVVESQFPHPEDERVSDRLGGERCANSKIRIAM